MASVSITYTPNYSGCHRICVEGTETTCCYIDNSPSIVGLPKTVTIDLDQYPCVLNPPNEIDCVGYSLNGYIQPCCTDADSLLNRVEFTAAWPVTICVQYELQCKPIGVQCAPFTFTDCSDQLTGPIEGLWSGPTVPPAVVCSSAGPPSGTGGNYDVTPITPGTCCNCKSYTVTNQSIVPISIYYTGCNYAFVDTPLVLDPLEQQTFCAIENTIWTTTQSGFFTAEDNGPCED